MFFHKQLPVMHAQNHRHPFKLLPIASFVLAMCFAPDAMTASIVSSNVNESSGQTELVIQFSEPIKEPVRMFKMSNPERKVIEFSNLDDHEKFSPQFEEGSRIKSAKIFSTQGRSRLVLELPNHYDVAQDATGNSIKLTVKGPKPFAPKSTIVANAASSIGLASDSIHKTSKNNPNGLVLQNLALQTESDHEVIQFQFDKPDIQVDTVVQKGELRLRVPMASLQNGLALPGQKSGMRLFSDLKLRPGDQVLTVSLNLNNAKHQLRQKGSVIELVLMPNPMSPELAKVQKEEQIAEVAKPQEQLIQAFLASSASTSAASLPQFEPMPNAAPMNVATVESVSPQPVAVSATLLPIKSGGDVVVSSRPQAKFGQDVLSNSARYTGKPISLDFKDTDVRTVLQVFAEFTKMNLVVSDTVQGKISVHLKDVPWDQALEIVMRSKGLVSSQSGNVLLVSSAGDGASEQIESAKRRAQDDMEPLVHRTLTVSYQKTEDLVAMLKSKDSKLMSSRGTIISDERTSQIFIEDTPSRIERIVSIVQSMDKPVKQVMIEARVVLADTSVSRDLGVRMRGASSRSTAFSTIADQFGSKGFVDTGPEASTSLAYTLFNSRSTRLITLQLRALETENKIKTVSNPRVITSNKEPAVIEQGTEIPYQIATSSGATAIEFKEANLKLEVTPQIAPDGTVLLDVNVSKDSVGIATANGPAIDTRRVKTKVLVSDGGTVVLGGIFEEGDNTTRDRTPFLSDVPVVGHLFRSKSEDTRKSELLIFLTPVILKES